MRRAAFLAMALLVVADDAFADVRLPRIFSDHMVLQREMPVHIWGFAEPGERVTVKIAGRTATTKAGEDGRWSVELAPLKAGGPHKLTVRGKNTVRVKDVLVGEVWLCSGQSNMEWPVSRSADAKAEIADARDKKIRHFKVAHRPAGSPVDDVDASWEVCSPDTVGQFTACGYFMARALRDALRVPVGLVNVSWGGTRIEPWTAPVGFAGVPALEGIAKEVEADAGKEPRSHQQASVLFNGMVHAIVGLSMRGAIWYQGESNHQDGALYTEKKKALIEGWRQLWGIGDFPFHFVQIAPFGYGKEAPGVLPAFWEAQAAVLDVVPNTGMVVINDIATLDNIHPPNKQDVGERLALLALRRTYGKGVVDSGPTFRSLSPADGTLRVAFDCAAGGLASRDRKPLTHFEVAGADTGFVPADAKIEGDTVVLSADGVSQPLAMRFAWHKLAEPNLVNGEGLPTGAFRAGEIPGPDFLGLIEEAEGYTLLCDLDLERLSTQPTYAVDERREHEGAFDRVAYLLELQAGGGRATYVWVSMQAFTNDANKLAVPVHGSGARFQQPVREMTIVSNDEGVTEGAGLTGNIEFWSDNYGPDNLGDVPHASPSVWDFGDQPTGPADGYGCMQVHHPEAKQTLFAINRFSAGGSGADIGIGSSSLDARTTDWTFAGNGGSYTHKRLRVFIRAK